MFTVDCWDNYLKNWPSPSLSLWKVCPPPPCWKTPPLFLWTWPPSWASYGGKTRWMEPFIKTLSFFSSSSVVALFQDTRRHNINYCIFQASVTPGFISELAGLRLKTESFSAGAPLAEVFGQGSGSSTSLPCLIRLIWALPRTRTKAGLLWRRSEQQHQGGQKEVLGRNIPCCYPYPKTFCAQQCSDICDDSKKIR